MTHNVLDQDGILAIWAKDIRLFLVVIDVLNMLTSLHMVYDIPGKVERHTPSFCASKLTPEMLLLQVSATGQGIGEFEITPTARKSILKFSFIPNSHELWLELFAPAHCFEFLDVMLTAFDNPITPPAIFPRHFLKFGINRELVSDLLLFKVGTLFAYVCIYT